MAALDPKTAAAIVAARKDVAVVSKQRGTGSQIKYAFRFKLLNPNGRHIAITTPDTQALISKGTQAGVTVYVNKLSRALNSFPMEFTERFLPGVTVTEVYPKGSKGRTGDKGLSSAAARLETLDPYGNDVLRLSVVDESAFRNLLNWYAGEKSFPPASGPASDPKKAGAAESATTVANLPGPSLELEPISVSSEVVISDAKTKPPHEEIIGEASITPSDIDMDEEERRIMSDPARRRVIERHAVELAITHYSSTFAVRELGKPFDLECIPLRGAAPGASVVHVEVKGTVGTGRTVHLTRNEVTDACEPGAWRSDLFIVSSITLKREPSDDLWHASGDVIRWIKGWRPDKADLAPTDYEYRVPQGVNDYSH